MMISKHQFAVVVLVVFLVCPRLSVAKDESAASTNNVRVGTTSGAPPVDDAAQSDTAGTKAAATTEVELQTFANSLLPLGPELKVGEAMLFDLKSGKLLRTFRRYQNHLRHVRFSPDNIHALLGFYDFSVLWNFGTGEAVREFDQGGIAQFSPDGSKVLIYDEWTANRYEVASGKQLASIPFPSGGLGFKGRDTRINSHIPNEVRRDASGAFIYNVEPTLVQQILDAATGKEIGQCPSNTGSGLVSGATKRVLQATPYNVVRIFDFKQQLVARFDMPPGEVPGVGGQLKAVSSDGKQFLYAYHVKGGGDNPGPKAQYRTMHYALYDAETGKELKVLGRFDTGYTASFSLDGRLTVLLPTFGFQGDDTRDPMILVINNASGAVELRLYTGPWALPSVDFDRTGNRLLVAGSINFLFWRRFGEWRQLEQQNPMPRKVADALKIIKDWQASDPGVDP